MLTPQDIDKKVFPRAVRGYKIEDVEAFLQEISKSYDQLYRENLIAKERIALLSDSVKQYKSMEETLQTALSVAQHNSDDIEQEAREQAAVIIQDAEKQAAQIAEASASEMAKATYQFEQMKRNVEVFRAKVVSLLNAQLDIIKEYGELQEDEKGSAGANLKAPSESSTNSHDQTTAEIPELVRKDYGVYTPKETK